MREDTILSLKWHSFPSHLAVSLDNCYEKQHFVDLSLVCKDGTILKCHKMVLANSSSFFRRLLVANDHPHPMIILHDVEADDLKTIINFMYCGEIQVVQSEVRRLLKLAEILEVTGLRHIQTSVLEKNDQPSDGTKKFSTESRFRIEDKNQTCKSDMENDNFSKSLHKTTSHSTKIVPIPSKHQNKTTSESSKKSEESNINAINQRLETGKSGISVVDIKTMQPSTSKGFQNQLPMKRKDNLDAPISWPQVLSAISKDHQLPLKKLCVMDEVEITIGKQLSKPLPSNEQLDIGKLKQTPESDFKPMKCAVFIKDEIDISSDIEESIDVDPLEVEEIEIDDFDSSTTSSQCLPLRRISHPSFNPGTPPGLTKRKNSNG